LIVNREVQREKLGKQCQSANPIKTIEKEPSAQENPPGYKQWNVKQKIPDARGKNIGLIIEQQCGAVNSTNDKFMMNKNGFSTYCIDKSAQGKEQNIPKDKKVGILRVHKYPWMRVGFEK